MRRYRPSNFLGGQIRPFGRQPAGREATLVLCSEWRPVRSDVTVLWDGVLEKGRLNEAGPAGDDVEPLGPS